MNRINFLKALSLIRPALSTQNFIPSLSHVRLANSDSGVMATAYNDTIGISVAIEWDHDDLLIPGELLIKALSGWKGPAFTASAVDGADLVLACGRSKLKLHTLPAEDFPFTLPQASPMGAIDVGNSVLKGLERCLDGVGRDLTHPEQMGVTLDALNGVGVLYATDNYTISRFATSDKLALPGDTPVILPTAFCESLLAVAKAFPEDDITLELHADSIVARIAQHAVVFSKVLADLEPMDFERVIGKHVKLAQLAKITAELPDGFGDALDRALLVLSTSADKSTKVTPADDFIKLHSTSELGDADDTLAFDLPPEAVVNIDPVLVTRGLKGCSAMGFLDRALVLRSAASDYMHLISYVAG